MTEDEMREMFGTEDPFSDFFRTFFGGAGGATGCAGARRPRSASTQRGRDLEQEVELTLEEAYHGATRRIGDHARRPDAQRGRAHSRRRQRRIAGPRGR